MLELAERTSSFRNPIGQAHTPLLYAALGEMHLGLGDVDQARAWFHKSAALWQKLQSDGKLNPMYAKEPSRGSRTPRALAVLNRTSNTLSNLARVLVFQYHFAKVFAINQIKISLWVTF